MKLTPKEVAMFQAAVWSHYNQYRRDMPWRHNTNPYWVMVAEIMLQQTQVDRVKPKFEAFVTQFPTIQALAQAPLSAVLQLWVGLGYNRRAKFLHGAAKEIMERYNGKIPATQVELGTLPGIGPNTAGAIAAYAFNQPVVFIETNIRTVVMYHFFSTQEKVNEDAIRQIVAEILDTTKPREWYWALMDYGTFLKKTFGNNIAKATIYRKQSTFHGSLRQVRGKVIALLAEAPRTPEELESTISDPRLPQVLTHLSHEKLIIRQENHVQLAE